MIKRLDPFGCLARTILEDLEPAPSQPSVRPSYLMRHGSISCADIIAVLIIEFHDSSVFFVGSGGYTCHRFTLFAVVVYHPVLLESDYPAKMACLSNASDLEPHTILPARECCVFQSVDMQDRDSLCETRRLRGDKFLNSHGNPSYFCCTSAVGFPLIWRAHQAIPSMCLVSTQTRTTGVQPQ
jgi:hypothetical protein